MKRLIDIVVSLLGLVLIWPLFGLIAWRIRVTMGRPILFRQARVGLAEKIFTLYKFRTMTDRRGAARKLLPDAERLTPLGSFLRKWSLDELPQLWNVLKGEMSFVGPRPLPPKYLPRYTPFQRRRHSVKPGITGWAQVNGRNGLTWEQKFALDVWYTENWSIWLDMKILARTAWKVVRREGISQAGHATMPEFLGSGHSGQSQASSK